MTEPLYPSVISIVTPSFKQLDWLRLAIASVADQAGAEHEHIVQDAGTPGVEKLFHGVGAKLFVEKDNGLYDAVNRGLTKARGEICAYLNCDEQYLPGTLMRVAEFFHAHPKIDIVFGDVLVVDRGGKALSYRRAVQPNLAHIRLSHLNTSSCATFFRKRIFDAGHRFDPAWKSIGDAVWISGLLQAGFRAAIYRELLSVFTLTGANISTDDSVSEREKQKWMAQPDAPSRFLRPWHVARHRLQKLMAGAYCRRTFEYETYTLDSPARRVRFHAKELGGKWTA